MSDDTSPSSAAADDSAASGGVTRQPGTPPQDSTPADDGTTTWAGNRSLDSRWWWSPALMVVVGVAVIGYQSGPIRTGDAIVLNWVMVAVGAVVAAAGLLSLRRAYAEHRAAQAHDEPPAGA